MVVDTVRRTPSILIRTAAILQPAQNAKAYGSVGGTRELACPVPPMEARTQEILGAAW